MMIGRSCSVGLVARIIVREIVHNIRVVGRRFIMPKRRKRLGMLDRVFLGSV